MKRYVIITNIWGKKVYIPTGKLLDVFKEEREEFDTIEEVNEYIKLFEDVCSYYEIPEKKIEREYGTYGRKSYKYEFTNTNQRLYGYIVGDSKTLSVLKWGGICMLNISKTTDGRKIKDMLFRGPDEIPKDYKWDAGEYEGWLQYRWGDGKNAIDYQEPRKAKKITEAEEFDHEIMVEEENEAYHRSIEEAFLKDEVKEKLKRIIDRW